MQPPSRTGLIVSALGTAIMLNAVVRALGIDPAMVFGYALSGVMAVGVWFAIQTRIPKK